MEINELETFYQELKKLKSDYVFSGEVVKRIPALLKYQRTKQEQLVYFLGGLICWIIDWRVTRRFYRENNVSKIEQKIIGLLKYYDVKINKGYCMMIIKEL